MINNVLVVGGGSAGFLAALTLKTRLPHLAVTVLRSKDVGIIGVGEGTTTTVGYHLHNYLKVGIKEFYRRAEPQWKLGIKFLWGPRPYFNYVFGYELDSQYNLLPRGTGYYAYETGFDAAGVMSCMMNADRVFLRRPDGLPHLQADLFTYHLENEKLVRFFETLAAERQVGVIDDTVVSVRQDERGVESLLLASGRTLAADLFVDASGFASILLGKALAEPFRSYDNALFCDRAVVGGWERGPDESIRPYTTAETMDAGWCWQIEHEHRVNRGYVYSSSFISDELAEREFRAKNPKVGPTRVVRFNPGRYERFWVKNVVGVGNAAGFVEPLEATSLASICVQAQALAESLADVQLDPDPVTVRLFNRYLARGYDAVRDFLAVHYRFNGRLATPFWAECIEKVELGAAEPIVEYYREHGPSVLWRRMLFDATDAREFGMEGYLAMLVGQRVPFRRHRPLDDAEWRAWNRVQDFHRFRVADAYTVPEALAAVRAESWQWPPNLYDRPLGQRN